MKQNMGVGVKEFTISLGVSLQSPVPSVASNITLINCQWEICSNKIWSYLLPSSHPVHTCTYTHTHTQTFYTHTFQKVSTYQITKISLNR